MEQTFNFKSLDFQGLKKSMKTMLCVVLSLVIAFSSFSIAPITLNAAAAVTGGNISGSNISGGNVSGGNVTSGNVTGGDIPDFKDIFSYASVSSEVSGSTLTLNCGKLGYYLQTADIYYDTNVLAIRSLGYEKKVADGHIKFTSYSSFTLTFDIIDSSALTADFIIDAIIRDESNSPYQYFDESGKYTAVIKGFNIPENHVNASDSWVYDSICNTLYLNNYVADKTFSADACEHQIFSDGDLNIVLSGKNYLNMTSENGIYVKGNLNIYGDGELNISNCNTGIYVNGNLTVNNTSMLNLWKVKTDIRAAADIEINNTSLKIYDDFSIKCRLMTLDSSDLFAALLNIIGDEFIVNGSELNVEGDISGCAIEMNSGKIEADTIDSLTVNSGNVIADRIDDIVIHVGSVFAERIYDIVTYGGIVEVGSLGTFKVYGGLLTVYEDTVSDYSSFIRDGEMTVYGSIGDYASWMGYATVYGGKLNVFTPASLTGSYGIYSTLTVNGGEVNVVTENCAAVNNIKVTGGKVNIVVENDYGVRSLDVTGGTVSISSDIRAVEKNISYDSSKVEFWAGTSASDRVQVSEYFGAKHVYFCEKDIPAIPEYDPDAPTVNVSAGNIGISVSQSGELSFVKRDEYDYSYLNGEIIVTYDPNLVYFASFVSSCDISNVNSDDRGKVVIAFADSTYSESIGTLRFYAANNISGGNISSGFIPDGAYFTASGNVMTSVGYVLCNGEYTVRTHTHSYSSHWLNGGPTYTSGDYLYYYCSCGDNWMDWYDATDCEDFNNDCFCDNCGSWIIDYNGDINLDGRTNSADARLLLRYVAGIESFYADKQYYLADIFHDYNNFGVIDSADAYRFFRALNGYCNFEPCYVSQENAYWLDSAIRPELKGEDSDYYYIDLVGHNVYNMTSFDVELHSDSYYVSTDVSDYFLSYDMSGVYGLTYHNNGNGTYRISGAFEGAGVPEDDVVIATLKFAKLPDIYSNVWFMTVNSKVYQGESYTYNTYDISGVLTEEETTVILGEATTAPEEITTEAPITEVPTTEPTTRSEETTTSHIHNYSDVLVAAPDCTTAGEALYTCSCGDSYIVELSPEGHKDSNSDGICDNCQEGEDNKEEVKLSFLDKIKQFFLNLFK